MRSLSNREQFSLKWTKAKGKCYELRANEEVFATLKWENSFGSKATGSTLTGQWAFKRVGFFKQYIAIRYPGFEVDFATLNKGKHGESLVEFSDGRTFLWKATKNRRKEMGFYDQRGILLLTIQPESGFIKFQGNVEINPEFATSIDVPLLAMLGWYQMVLKHEDESAAVAAIAAGA